MDGVNPTGRRSPGRIGACRRTGTDTTMPGAIGAVSRGPPSPNATNRPPSSAGDTGCSIPPMDAKPMFVGRPCVRKSSFSRSTSHTARAPMN